MAAQSMKQNPAPTMAREEALSLPALITKHEVSRLLGMHERTVVLMAQKGKLPARLCGTRYLFNTAAILELVGLGGGCNAA